MGKRFLRSSASRTGYIYPDNYMGAGSAETLTVGVDGGGNLLGGYERALVLGQVNTHDGEKKGVAVKLLDLRHIDGSCVYGVVPEKDLFLGYYDKPDKDVCAKTLFAGNIVTVSVEGQSGVDYYARGDHFDATYICSRRRVLEDVRRLLRELPIDEIVVGRVCGRGKNWSYKVDIGGGFRIYVNERSLGRHSVHSRSAMSGGLLYLRKTVESCEGNADYKTCSYTFEGSVNDLLHGAQARGILTRADGSGQNFVYIPNCGFIYIAGYVDKAGDNKPLRFGEGGSLGDIKVDGRELQLGCVVQVEIVRGKDGKLCGYIRSVLSQDAISGCTIL